MMAQSDIGIAAAIVQREDGKILLLQRAQSHSTNPGKWCFVTGYVEDGEAPHEAAIRELREELGIEGVHPVRAGNVVTVPEDFATLHVHPFLFKVMNDDSFTLDWEHEDYRWISPDEVYTFDIVKQLDDDLKALGLL